MTTEVRFAESPEALTGLQVALQRQLDTATRLPDWPFLAASGFVTIYEYDRVLGGTFGIVLESLAQVYGDEAATVVGLDPPAAYYQKEYNYFPGFQIDRDSMTEGYAVGLRHEPGGDSTGAMAYTTNVLGLTGSSGAWSVWGQRDWEIGLLLTPQAEGPWLQAPVAWFGRDVDLDSIRSPAGWGVPLGEQERSKFWRNLRERGSGP
ncbi:MAG: hypothetical protein M3256_06975 [Actinomycetota bacterium]|nr:hypothetical protein [Actinomycetota bacterium]